MLTKSKKYIMHRGMLSLIFAFALSVSTILSPLVRAEEPSGYMWKTLTSMPAPSNNLRNIYISPDGSKLFIFEEESAFRTVVWMSADDGATWKKIFSKQGTVIGYLSSTVGGSKITLVSDDRRHLYISTDGGQNWTGRALPPWYLRVIASLDGSFLVACGGDDDIGYTTDISTDDGQTWTQQFIGSIGCPTYISNNGTMMAPRDAREIVKSTDYGQTWTEIFNFSNNPRLISFSNNGNNVFEGDRISLDGGNHWTPSNASIPSGNKIMEVGISEDGKKLFINTQNQTSPVVATLLTSVDGGRTWHAENTGESMMIMSSDGSKLFHRYEDRAGNSIFRVGTLSTSQSVAPGGAGSGTSGAATPSTGSSSSGASITAASSSTSNKKPGKSSSILAETGTSIWVVGGVAIVAVAVGVLVLRKRL